MAAQIITQVAPSAQKSNVVPLRAQNPQAAQELIKSVSVRTFTLDELNLIIRELPLTLESVISMLSADTDCYGNARKGSSTVVAMRLLAMIAANLSAALETSHQ